VHPNLRYRLGRLLRAGGDHSADLTRGSVGDEPAADDAARSRDAPNRRRRVPALEDLLPGTEVATPRGVCWRHDRPLEQWPGTDPGLYEHLARTLVAPVARDLERDAAWQLWRSSGLDAGLFLDLETTGLSATPVFLAGLLVPEDGKLLFRLYLARDYAEEAALLAAVGEEVRRRPVVVTYNGKSYDLPFLRERTGRLRGGPVTPGAVLDLLHPARRRWGARLPDCRLKTLEWHLCARKRAGDIDGADIPATYHRFVRERDPRPLIRILSHNLLDLYTLAEVTGHVAQAPLPEN
jgi:uncharacterized protein YprB with RNaseH-like and TPR domain